MGCTVSAENTALQKGKEQNNSMKKKISDDSSFNIKELPQFDPRIPLTARQRFNITKSWKGIARNIEHAGILMFLRLFETNNEIQAMFSSMTKGNYDIVDLRTNKKLENHVTQVMFTLDEAISSLDDADVVINLLHTVGHSHRRLPCFDPQIFWKIEEPFLLAVKDTLGDRYTANMEHIYRKTIKFILQTLIDGFNMKNTECDVKSDKIPEWHDPNLTTTEVVLKLSDG
ncbi:hypothetical protein ACJMK2_037806 [Sinanodonta woodiana]|uniref:Globin domain-containing protein n=1 Tax=Sinanodonta woodiana TaxID=1069815 RepID=A0ABD3WLK5_SINWO